MPHLLKRILFFLIFPILFVAVMDFQLRKLNLSYKAKISGIINSKDSIRVLVLGNSHANYGVNPSVFDTYVYNLANVSQSFYYDDRLTRKMMPEMPKLKVVLISVDYHTLYLSSESDRETWSYLGNGVKYKDHSYLLENLSPFLFGYKPKISFLFFAKYLKMRIGHKKNAAFVDSENGVDIYSPIYRGFLPFIGNFNRFNADSYRTRADYATSLIKKSNENKSILKELESFIVYLRSKGIEPVLFSCPTYSEYNKFLDRNIVETNRAQTSNIATKYNLHVLNYNESSLFDQTDFYDTDHLNLNGSIKFSRIINDSLKQWKLMPH